MTREQNLFTYTKFKLFATRLQIFSHKAFFQGITDYSILG